MPSTMMRCAIALGVCALPPLTASAEPWTRGYVVNWIEHAAYFGADGEIPTTPGTDCPKGTEPEMDLTKVLVTSYRSPEEVQKILDPDHEADENLFEAMTKRGLNGENIYRNPKSAPDPGMIEMEGDIAYGFNLDGDESTGFTSPTGEKGIDNNFYKAWGCWEAFRGPPRMTPGGIYHNDEMLNGKFTVVMLISGEQDPMNDDDVTLGIYTSKDKIVKDAAGNVAPHYSFRIDAKDTKFASVLDAKISDGVLELTHPQDITMREASFLAALTLHEGRARLNVNEDGTLDGMIGGYKPIQEAISTWTIAGPNVELVTHVNLSAAYYAIERAADAQPDPETGQNTAVSTAVNIWATPAFVIKPDASAPEDAARSYASAANP